jgi:predicted helicase
MDKVDEGIVGIITNHSFLDNPTFRGLRQSLMNTFDRMYFIDLHGNSERKEKTPEGGKDENVFDIKQGVAISILIKKKGLEKRIYHTDWFGKRKEKYNSGWEEELKTIKWGEVSPKKPLYLFQIQKEVKEELYKSFSVKEIFESNSVGVVTSDDDNLIAFDEDELLQKVKHRYDVNDTSLVKVINKMPFDKRYVYFDNSIIERARYKFMLNFDISNLGLVVSKQVLKDYRHVFVTPGISSFNYLDKAGRFGSGFIFPLYKYSIQNNKEENFKLAFRQYVHELYNYLFTPT